MPQSLNLTLYIFKMNKKKGNRVNDLELVLYIMYKYSNRILYNITYMV